MNRARNRAPAPFRGVSFFGWLTIAAFVTACIAYQFGALTQSSTLVVLAAALLGYASIVTVLGRGL